MQFKVKKSDGTLEIYRHTKVLGVVATALGESGMYHANLAESLAEAVTIYLRRRYESRTVGFDEIYAMIQAALTDTGHEAAAVQLHEHRILRQLQRGRVEVIKVLKTAPTNDRNFSPPEDEEEYLLSALPWNKSRIIADLIDGNGVEQDLARVIAGSVEEKVLRLDCGTVSSSLVRELVNHELRSMKQAETALTVQADIEKKEKSTVADAC